MPYDYGDMKSVINNAFERVERSIYTPVCDIDITAWVTKEPVPFEKRTTGKEMHFKVNDKWGELWDCAWFNFKGTVPASLKGKKTVLLIDLSGEGCVFDESGCPVQGLTTYCSQFDENLGRPGKKVVRFSDCAKGNEQIDLWLDAGCNDLFGNYKDSGTIKEACVAEISTEMRDLYYDFKVLIELYKVLPENKAREKSILFSLYEAANLLIDFTDSEAIACRKVLSKELNKKNGDPSLTVSAIGHAHIDLAWLWPIRETIRKGARTFSTALKNMDYYDDYVFGASQPQLYQWMKDYYPALFERIKEKIKEGRWEPQGAMWVESDTNIPSGESLIRQIYYGKKFFKDEFGVEQKILWLPDVFGYTASLPQIMKKSGVDYFMTIKLSWCKVDTYPHSTFMWKGIDGSSVLTHLPPEGTYNSPATPKSVAKSEDDNSDSGVSNESLMLFGIGDGGGGPGEDHLEMLKREKNLAGIAPVHQEPAINFFERLEKGKDKYSTWNGELYLEAHQGTYTTQSENKRYNREMEELMHNAEFLSVLANLSSGMTYPQKDFEKVWKDILLYQFHDIIPGSSIARVYKESSEIYKQLEEKVNGIIAATEDNICKTTGNDTNKETYTIFNTLGWKRKEWVNLDGSWKLVEVPSMGYTSVEKDNTYDFGSGLAASDNLLENDFYIVKFADDGSVSSIYDKENDRQVLSDKANVLAVYQDNGDAWEYPSGYRDRKASAFVLESSTAEINGPFAQVKSTYRYGKSIIHQTVRLTKHSRRIDFITNVDWNESSKMLRTSFPLTVSSNESTCEIQFGSIKRPTTANTSWEKAKFEVCAHHFADISEKNYGAALLNNCKYGYFINENTLDLNLLRSTHYPDPTADIGSHEFTYSLFPHAGDCEDSNTVHAGYELNYPLIVKKASNCSSNESKSLVSVDNDNVIIETVKKAFASDAALIRLYECHGTHTKATLNVNILHSKLIEADLMENEISEIGKDSDKLSLSFTPFEIKTILVKP